MIILDNAGQMDSTDQIRKYYIVCPFFIKCFCFINILRYDNYFLFLPFRLCKSVMLSSISGTVEIISSALSIPAFLNIRIVISPKNVQYIFFIQVFYDIGVKINHYYLVF